MVIDIATVAMSMLLFAIREGNVLADNASTKKAPIESSLIQQGQSNLRYAMLSSMPQ
jgi:hypothetical protein